MDVVISDLHIGHPDSTFSSGSAENVFERFIQEVKETDSVEKLILLGDVFDFWSDNLSRALRKSLPFFEKIAGMTEEIIYVPGNHDHHSLVLCKEVENSKRMENGKIPSDSFCDLLKYEYPKVDSDSVEMKLLAGILPGLQNVHIQLFYPEYTCKWKKKDIVLRHGHYLDSGLFTLMPWLLEHIGGKIESEKDFEVVNTPVYEYFYWCGTIEEITIFYRVFHEIYKFLLI